jgi:hypothetical protein
VDNPGSPWKEKRRADRLDVGDENAVSARLLVPEAGDAGRTVEGFVRTVSVRNCSIELKAPADVNAFRVGQVCAATLVVEGAAVPLQVEVARVVKPNEVAVKFKPPFPRELKSLEKFLEPRFLGRSLREIDPARLQQKEGSPLRWFQGANETGLFSWADPKTGAIVQQQLVFLARVAEWGGKSALRTGRIREESGAFTRGWVRSELLDFDAKSDAELLKQAGVLLNAAGIDDEVKKVFLEKIYVR